VFLTPDELETLTGYTWPAKQRQWLTRHGWLFEIASNGRPVVTRSYAESRLGALPATKTWMPNLSALA
jgi:hypothetical protein